jgi:transposase
MLVPRQQYSRELKIACMRELDAGKGLAEIARQYQLSPKRMETWKSEWRAKGELAFPGKGARPQARLDGAHRRVRAQNRTAGDGDRLLKKSLAAFQGASSGSRRQWRWRIYQQIREAAKAEDGVSRLCRVAGLSRAGYYRFRRRHESQPALAYIHREASRPASLN